MNTAIAFKGKKGVLISAIESKDANTVNPSVEGFPTFCYYHNGKWIPHKNFSKSRSAEEFKKWVSETIGKATRGRTVDAPRGIFKTGGKSRKNKKQKRTVKKSRSSRKMTRKWLNLW